VHGGADLEAADADGNSVLAHALKAKRMSMVGAILELGGSPNCEVYGMERGSDDVRSALTATAGARGDEVEEVLARLIKLGATVGARDADGRTALHLAAKVSEKRIKLLLKAGADPKARDATGTTPLHLAAGEGEDEIKAMLEAGAEVDAIDIAGKTPLFFAVQSSWGAKDCIDALVAAGANVSARSIDGECLIANAESLATCRYLRKLGCCPSEAGIDHERQLKEEKAADEIDDARRRHSFCRIAANP
jgi:ankyrin repeat protein